jgi:Dyp-type peroxidase family
MSTVKLPLDSLQGIVLHGYGHLHLAAFALLSVERGRGRDARRFLASLELTSASRAARRGDAPGPFVNVAFTHAGLVALGLPFALLDDFPRDFVEGPTMEARARRLGDEGESHPSRWIWGSRTTEPVHVMLLLYAGEKIDALYDRYLREAVAGGLREVQRLDTLRLPRRQEHFGFRDGISQPIVAGDDASVPPLNGVAQGEFFLGRENSFGEDAHVPGGPGSVLATDGSYLVVRQLEQDVRGFWAFCHATGSTDESAIRLASRMVGRWPSGAPLVQHPEADFVDPAASDAQRNGFEYREQDPTGARCPFGSHIRRSNPRDWGVADTATESRKAVARHRIIRRGRAYGRPLTPDAEPRSYLKALDASDPDPRRGLHFLCFNASIEQQFEFVQRQWCNNPKFAGAVNGADPLIGDHRELAGEPPTFSIQHPTTPERVPLARRFVHTRGGAYLLLPTIAAVASLANA